MKLGMIIDYAGGFAETVELIQEYERNGLELVAIPEAYSFDAVSQLGYIAAKTEKIELMSAILQVYTRTPSLTAMTAAGLATGAGIQVLSWLITTERPGPAMPDWSRRRLLVRRRSAFQLAAARLLWPFATMAFLRSPRRPKSASSQPRCLPSCGNGRAPTSCCG